MSLRRLLTPFFKATHPDLLHHASAQVKRTNERSLQQLNTIIDTIEHLGGSPHRRQEGGGRSQTPYLESSYELTFHLVGSHGKKRDKAAAVEVEMETAAASATAAATEHHSFTTRLIFPATTVSRLQREAPLAASAAAAAATASAKSHDHHQQQQQHGAEAANGKPQAGALLPDEIADQLRKLFQGAKLRVPKELEASGRSASGRGGGGRRRGGLIGKKEAERMLLQDLMGRDLRVDGPGQDQRRAAAQRLLRSGRVLTRGLPPAEEAGALRQLEAVLVAEWDRAHLGEAGRRLQVVLDADAPMLRWQALGEGKGHLVVCPADVKGCRYRLGAILREIGLREMQAAGNGPAATGGQGGGEGAGPSSPTAARYL